MHKLTYTPAEYNNLLMDLESSYEGVKDNYEFSKNWGRNKHSSIVEITRLIRRSLVRSLYKYSLYKRLKDELTQHEFQILYHEPFKNLPLLISHRNKIVVVFVLFRLKIGK